MKRAALIAAVLLLCCTAAAAQNAAPPDRDAQEQEAQQRLDSVRAEIKALTQAQRALEGERNEAADTLRVADQSVNTEARGLRDIDVALVEQEQTLTRLEGEKTALEQRLGEQREALAALLRSAYALGRHEQLKLLLAQDRIDKLARVLAYHRYFQRDRVGRIDTLLKELEALSEIGRAVIAQREQLAQSRGEQQERVAQLESLREERRTVLAGLEQKFKTTQSRLAALGRDERALLQLLESLRDVFADIPRQIEDAEPFAKRRGALPMPLQGRVGSAYGGTLPDGRKSQGWLIDAARGAPVAAVAPGRVAFADWLKGYGLILILDHGDGYMSLYAQNDSLLKEVGDWVARGEVLAGVGSSGGQSEPALYFELRHNGRPVDPGVWILRR